MADGEKSTFFETTDIKVVDGFPLPTRQTRKLVVACTLTFCAMLAVLVTFSGNPENSLHVSAQSWAFGMATATVFAYVFGAVIDNFNVIKNITGTTAAKKKANG